MNKLMSTKLFPTSSNLVFPASKSSSRTPVRVAAAGNSHGSSGKPEPRGNELQHKVVSESQLPTKPRAINGHLCEPLTCKRPSRIILVRHGESEGNVDESVYRRKPDNRLCLTDKGKIQAREAGQKIAEIIGDDDVYFYVSPYRRAQETLYEIGMQLDRERILGVREDARLREQDFGNFQDEAMGSFKEARRRFSRFFFRFRDGESAADVYDRITTFRETLRNDIDFGRFGTAEKGRETTVVIVSHGLTLRVFMMRWYKWTVDMFECVRNLQNAGLVIMERGTGGRFSLAVRHTVEDLRRLGLTREMIDDQIWQMSASPKSYNSRWPTSGPAFFDLFEAKLREEQLSRESIDYDDLSGQLDIFKHTMEFEQGSRISDFCE